MTPTTIQDPSSTAFPRPIRRALRRIDARLRVVASARGLGTAVLVAALGAVVGMAADFAWVLPSPARWAIWCVWATAVGSVVALGVVRPWIKKARWIDLAAVAERSDPGLGERLTGSIALLDGEARPHGSPALIAALAAEAADRVGSFDPALAVKGGRAARRLAIGVLTLAVVAAPSLIRPDPFAGLALRFLAPWRDLDRVGWFAIEVKPGDRTVAIGSDFRIEARVAPRIGTSPAPEAAWLEWTDAIGQAHRSRMAVRTVDRPAPARDFEVTLPRLAGSMSYRVATRAARSQPYRVTAVEPPSITALSARIEPPAYTRLPAGPARDPARIEAVEGSRITLTVVTNRRVAEVEIAWPSSPPAPPRVSVADLLPDCSHSDATLEAEASGPYVVTPRHDQYGLDGRSQTRQIVVRPDAPPTLVVRGPASAGEARPDDVLPVGVAARDDFAVASAELHYEIRRSGSEAESRDPVGHIALPIGGLGTPLARGVGSLRLRDLALKPGDALAYRVRVADNRPAPRGPNLTWSEPRAIAIVASAEPMVAKDDRLRRESFGARLEGLRKANAANRRETEQLRYAADAAQRNGAAWDPDRDLALAGRESEARSIADQLQVLARDLQADPSFEAMARPTRQAAEVEAEAGRAQLEKARRAPDPGKRLAELRQADARLGALGNRLDEIHRQFEALAKLDLDRQKLRDLAAREEAMAARAADPAGDKDKLAADQDDLRKALDALLSQSPGLRAGLLAAQAEEAARLAREARALADRQRAEARKTAEAPRVEAPLRELALAQKALEDDARRLALDVDDPLAENGRARADTESLRRAVEPIERGDLPEAVRKLDDAEESLRRLTRDIEDVPLDPRALARRLARRQEALANDVAAAVADARRKDNLAPDERLALAGRLKPLADRQEQVARLAAGIVAPEPQKGAAREAAQSTDRALENLKALRPRDSENVQNAARRALNQLADALADPNRRREEARRKLDEAKRKEEEVARDLDRHLAETRLKPDKLTDEARAATDLADRIGPLVPKQQEAAALLAALDVEPRVRPQRDRAAARAARLADRLKAVKDQAPPRQGEVKAKPPARWHILLPFPTSKAPVPFDPARAVDLGATVNGPDGNPRSWKPAQLDGEEGKVDLTRMFRGDDNQSAFGYAEIVSPTRRKAQLALGSDDTMLVWLNGKPVFQFDGSRACTPGQDKVEVELAEGVNRLVVRCGNGNGEWGFVVGVTPPPPEGFSPDRARTLRESLASARTDALAAVHRLEQKSQGRMPADDLAEALAAEQKQAADRLAQERSKPPEDDPTPREQAAADRRRIATALRNLPVAAEAPALHAEAARLADEAARLDADPRAAQLAAEAADALARRLTDTLPPRALAAALARAERALGAPEPQADPAQLADRQKAIATELADLPPGMTSLPSPLADQAAQAVRRASELADRAKQPDRGNPSKPGPDAEALAAARREAAGSLEKLAADPALGPDPAKPQGPAPEPAIAEVAAVPSDPDLGLGPDQAARAADLAVRQRQVRERLQAEMAGRVGPQQALRRDASALGRELAGLRDRTREINARNHWQASSAADLAGEHAPRAMDQAAEQLAQGRLDQARDAQRQAADFIERAARDAEDLAAGLRAEGPGQSGEAVAAASSGLSDAREEIGQLSRQLARARDGQGTPQAAAPGMHQAAESLRTAARSPGAGPPAPPGAEPDSENPDPTASPAGVAAADLSALQNLVRKKTGRKWGELPGHLRTEILQLSRGRYRDDYARLIQLYFREIAADATGAEKP